MKTAMRLFGTAMKAWWTASHRLDRLAARSLLMASRRRKRVVTQ